MFPQSVPQFMPVTMYLKRIADKLLIDAEERTCQEFPYSGDMLASFPIILQGRDSRYWYGLNTYTDKGPVTDFHPFIGKTSIVFLLDTLKVTIGRDMVPSPNHCIFLDPWTVPYRTKKF